MEVRIISYSQTPENLIGEITFKNLLRTVQEYLIQTIKITQKLQKNC